MNKARQYIAMLLDRGMTPNPPSLDVQAEQFRLPTSPTRFEWFFDSKRENILHVTLGDEKFELEIK